MITNEYILPGNIYEENDRKFHNITLYNEDMTGADT